MDIQQGNVVTPKMMMQLKPGMNKTQVRYVMGTPLITDSFHPNRWDYFYSMKKDGRLIEQRRIILEFEDEKLARVRGDVVPAGSDAAATDQAKPESEQAKSAPAAQSKSAPPKEEKGWMDRLKFWGDDKKTEQPQEVKAAPAPVPQPAKIEEAKPAPVPQPVAEQQPQPDAATTPEGEKKGWLDKLKFWGDDKKAEPPQEATPAPAPVIRQPAKIETKPVPKLKDEQQLQTKPVAVPQEEDKGVLGSEPEAQPIVAPVVQVEEPKPQAPPVKPAPVAESVQPKQVPKPDTPLPPEDDPTYFEHMLEKIGF